MKKHNRKPPLLFASFFLAALWLSPLLESPGQKVILHERNAEGRLAVSIIYDGQTQKVDGEFLTGADALKAALHEYKNQQDLHRSSEASPQ